MLKQPRYQKYRDSRNLADLSEQSISDKYGQTNPVFDNSSVSLVTTSGWGSDFVFFNKVKASSEMFVSWKSYTNSGIDSASYSARPMFRAYDINMNELTSISDVLSTFANWQSYNNHYKSFWCGVKVFNDGETLNSVPLLLKPNVAYISIGFSVSSASAGEMARIENFMLNEGSTALPYEPYGVKIPDGIGEDADIVPFHSDHRPVEVSVGRKSRNLLNPAEYKVNATAGSTISPDGLITIDSDISVTRYHGWYGLDNLPTGTYTASLISDDLSNNTTLYAIVKNTSDYKHNAKVGSSTTIEHIQGEVFNVWCAISATDAGKQYCMQLELGDTATPYEPYGLNGTITDPLYTPRLESKSGSTIEFTDSYNYECEVSIDGKSEQKQLSGSNKIYVDDVTWTIPDTQTEYQSKVVWSDRTQSNKYLDMFKKIGKTVSYRIMFDYTANVTKIQNNATNRRICVQLNTRSSDGAGNVKAYLAPTVSEWFTEPGVYSGKTFGGGTITLVDGHEWSEVLENAVYSQGICGEFSISNIQMAFSNTNNPDDMPPYEPYCGAIPSPNPDYPQEIESIESVEIVSRGRNLWEYVGHTNPAAAIYSTFMLSPGTYCLKDFDENAVPQSINHNWYLGFSKDGHKIEMTPNIVKPTGFSVSATSGYVYGGTERNEISFTLNEPYFIKCSRYQLSEPFRCMLTENEPSEVYEPYHAHTATIDLQGNKLRSLPDGTKDTLRVYRDGRVELVKPTVDFRPTVFGSLLTLDSGYKAVAFNSPNKIYSSAYNQSMHEASYYDATRSNPWSYYENPGNFVVLGTKTSTRDEIVSKFSGKLIVYKRDVPEIIQLPSIDPIPQFYPTTILDGNGNDITGYVTVVDNG